MCKTLLMKKLLFPVDGWPSGPCFTPTLCSDWLVATRFSQQPFRVGVLFPLNMTTSVLFDVIISPYHLDSASAPYTRHTLQIDRPTIPRRRLWPLPGRWAFFPLMPKLPRPSKRVSLKRYSIKYKKMINHAVMN